MKILVLTQYYPPEGVVIPWTIAREMADRGHEVRVITGYPNYPTGTIYSGYKQQWRHEERDGSIEILRVPLFADHSTKLFARALNYVSFALSAATARKFAENADVIYVYATQMTPAFGPWLWRKLGGAPFVLHVQDLWPDSITGSSMASGSKISKVVDAALNPWLKDVYKSAASIIGIAPTMVETLVERGAPECNTRLIYNWADDSAAERPRVAKTEDRSTINILFAGNVGDMQDLETVVHAAYKVKDTSVKVTIVGDGVALDKVKLLAGEIGAENVSFRSRVSQKDMTSVYSQADFALVTLKDLDVFRGTIPSKFQAAIAHGLPVISNVQGDLRNLVEDLGIGITAEAEDPRSLGEAFDEASKMSSEKYHELCCRTRKSYRDFFSRSSGIDAVEALLLRAVVGEPPEA